MLIRAYGLFWRSEEIDWNPERGGGRVELPRFALLGRVGSRAELRVCDFMDQRGLYILYGDYGPHYAGVTTARALGLRLKEHRSDTHRNRWDRFSWFGFRKVGRGRNQLGLSELSELALTTRVVQKQMIREMEALLIRAMGLQNIRQDPFPGGEEWTQIRRDEKNEYIQRLLPGRNPVKPRSLRGKS